MTALTRGLARSLALQVRIHRFEAVAVAIFTIAALGASAGLWARLLAFGLPRSCFASGPGFDQGCAARQFEVTDYLTMAGELGTWVLIGIAFMPLVAGLVLGVSAVGQEIERRTAALAWSVAPSRRRWLLGAVVPGAVFVTAACLVAGVIANGLEAARNPTVDPNLTFQHLGLRGVAIGAAGLGVFGIALAAGARLGRVLPALLVSGALALGLYAATSWGIDEALKSETIARPYPMIDDSGWWETGRVYDTRVRTPEGEVITWDEAFARYPEFQQGDPEFLQDWDQVLITAPGELYPITEWRMAIVFAAIGLAGIVLAFAFVERRRPT